MVPCNEPKAMKIVFDESLLNIVVCPKTHTHLVLDKKNHELISKTAGLAYPIRDGVPILIMDQAREIQDNS